MSERGEARYEAYLISADTDQVFVKAEDFDSLLSDWNRLLKANAKFSDELAAYRLLPCTCPECGHEHMADVMPRSAQKTASEQK